jgi:hypothetical protein
VRAAENTLVIPQVVSVGEVKISAFFTTNWNAVLQAGQINSPQTVGTPEAEGHTALML